MKKVVSLLILTLLQGGMCYAQDQNIRELKQKQENSIPVVFMEAAKFILDKYTYNFILEEAKKAIEKRQNPNLADE